MSDTPQKEPAVILCLPVSWGDRNVPSRISECAVCGRLCWDGVANDDVKAKYDTRIVCAICASNEYNSITTEAANNLKAGRIADDGTVEDLPGQLLPIIVEQVMKHRP